MARYDEVLEKIMRKRNDVSTAAGDANNGDLVRLEKSFRSSLDEAGGISSIMAIKKHHNLIKLGREVLKSRTARSTDKQMARMLVELGHLCLMSVSVSGEASGMSQIGKIATLRKL